MKQTKQLIKQIASKIEASYHKWFRLMPIISILLMVSAIVANTLFAATAKQAELPDYASFSETLDPTVLNFTDSAIVYDGNVIDGNYSASGEDFLGFALIDKSSFLNTTPSTNIKPLKGNLLTYKIGQGETISTIAKNFGISQNTILWANNIKSSNLIKPDQEIVILPVSGVLHEVKIGESIQSIADLYAVSPDSITAFNKSKIIEGDTVIVPNAKPLKNNSENNKNNLPDIGDYLAFPIKDGWNWGKLHLNAVDISAACGTPIYAAAEGLVEEVGSPKEWHAGAGGFIKISHPLNGFNGNIETFYAHTSKNLVQPGDYVSRGDEIALIGNTGNVNGPTGCHVHFGVFGAKHPFAK